MSELLVSLKARLERTSAYLYNSTMQIESELLKVQIKAIEERLPFLKDFETLLNEFERRAIVNAESGGGHPEDIPFKKEDYKEIRAELLAYVKERL